MRRSVSNFDVLSALTALGGVLGLAALIEPFANAERFLYFGLSVIGLAFAGGWAAQRALVRLPPDSPLLRAAAPSGGGLIVINLLVISWLSVVALIIFVILRAR